MNSFELPCQFMGWDVRYLWTLVCLKFCPGSVANLYFTKLKPGKIICLKRHYCYSLSFFFVKLRLSICFVRNKNECILILGHYFVLEKNNYFNLFLLYLFLFIIIIILCFFRSVYNDIVISLN